MRKLILRAGPAAIPLALLLLFAATARRAPAPPGPAPEAPRWAVLSAEAKRRVRTVGAAELKARLEAGERLLLLDVREDSEWDAGRIPGAVHLSRGVLESRIEKAAPDPAGRVVLYCASGARSALAAESLRRMGYANAFSLDGGLRAWKEAGGPTERR